jgi:hypothetical protein
MDRAFSLVVRGRDVRERPISLVYDIDSHL